MKYVTACIVVVLMGLMVAVPAVAGGIEQGTVELGTSTGFSYQSYSPTHGGGVKVTDIRLDARIGYFASTMFEFQVGMLVNHTNVDSDGGVSASATDRTDTGMDVLFALNFPTESAVVPFVGVGVGFLGHGGDVGSADKMTITAPTAIAGMRFLVGNSASVNLGVSYEYQINALGVEDVSAKVVMLNVGISAFVHGGRAD